ncbi:MAG: hypothetical protein HC913_17165 [Microscillaceae bacterium]|nr:hypothetical protein [Microscillaceae bacterium]
MKIEILQPSCYYHIYNRGIDGTNLFREEKNYPFFLQKYVLHLSEVVDTFAYCQLKNHFHLLIRVKDIEAIRPLIENKTFKSEGLHSVEHLVSKKFANLFNSYTQSFNKVYGRTGSLFETPFRRKHIGHDAYLYRVIAYIHQNPQHHGFVSDFRAYEYSSYHSLLSHKSTRLRREDVLALFQGSDNFVSEHLTVDKENQEWVIEF